MLFKERLKQPLRASQCLQSGGLWAEAIGLYEELGEWETVGDLCRQLDREDDAVRAYRRVVAKRLDASDYFGAAKLLEEKLAVPDEAYETLLGGWTIKPQQAFLDAAFDLLARHGNHERASQQVARLAVGEVPAHLAEQASMALARVATTYPQDDVRRQAADTTRGFVAALCPSLSPTSGRGS